MVLLQQPDLIGGTLNVLPIITFAMGVAITIIQLYVASRMAKIEEKVLTTVRAEAEKQAIAIYKEISNVEMGANIQTDKIRHDMVTNRELTMQIKLLKQEHLNETQAMLKTVNDEHRQVIENILKNHYKP